MQTYATRKTASPPLTSNRAMSKAPRLSNSDILNTLGELPSREIDLSAAMTAKINERFGTPLNGLRVFRDSGLEDMGQRAFARGNEIHIAGNESASDERLMLHEATHVVQQGSGLAQGSGLLQNSSLEAQANAKSYVGSFAMPTSGEGPIQGWNPITFMAKYARKAVKRFWHGKKKSDDATMKGFYERTDLPAADVLEPEARAVPDEDITPGGVAKMAAGGVADTSNYLGLALNNVFTTPGKMAEAVDGKGTPNPVLSAMSVDGDTAPGNLALDTFGGTMSAVGGLTKMALSANAAHKARKSGNTSGAVGGVVDVFKAAGGAATGAAKIAGTIGANVPAQVIPGLGVFTGGLQFAKGVVDMADAGANRSNLT
ncbi:MAG: DUF4157 domain-containing protein, partial [Oscillospiraceae bacterium]|nr:DUF4157 domain-containing protein [Oscillospiraceae bacterium]